MESTPQARPGPDPDVGGERATLLFEALAHPYRRFALWYLEQTGGVATVSQLADALDAREWVATPSRGGVDHGDRVALALRHTHLPKLEDADLVEREDRTVALLSRADAAVECLSVVGAR